MSGRRLTGRARQPRGARRSRQRPRAGWPPPGQAPSMCGVPDHATTPATFVAVALPARLLRNRRSVQ